ncbi:MAG: peptidoglycan-binding domain-containing protein [Candidatus Thiodiazotropha endolucinida]
MAINFNKVPRYIHAEIDPPTKIIEQGVKNGTVQRIQEWLNYHQIRTVIDNDYGPATRECIRNFQKKTDLPITGKVNKKTWEALVSPIHSALSQPSQIESLSASEVVMIIATQHVEQRPFEIGGANEGPWVRLYCGGYHGRDWAWCAGFVTLIMHQAYFYRGQRSPIKGSVSCDSLAAQAKRAGLFVPGHSIVRGEVNWNSLGDCCIFLKRRTATDWTHAGIAFGARGSSKSIVFFTIEGNTNDEGSREGYEACRRIRSLGSGSYDFIAFK